MKQREIAGFYSSYGDIESKIPTKTIRAAMEQSAEPTFSSLAARRESLSKICKRREIGGHYSELDQSKAHLLRLQAEEELIKFMLK